MLLLDYARSLGLSMDSIGQPAQGSRHIGWTTDEGLMRTLRDAGALAVTGYGVDDSNQGVPGGKHRKSADTPMGWEISFRQGAEAHLERQAAA